MAAGRGGAMAGPSLAPHRLRRILILAPHPDDDIVACGIAARHARAKGAEIFVLFLTTGVPPRETLWPWRGSNYNRRVERRREEALAAMMQLGAQPAGFLDLPSRGLIASLDTAAAVLEQALRETRAGELWVTAFEGAHQDHDAANALAANFRDRLPVWEFAAYNFAGAKVRSNRFPDARGGVVELRLSREEGRLKRRMLALYASESGNLSHIRVEQEAWRPLPRYDYVGPPHPGTLFRERFHWVLLRHPRIDLTPSAEIYAVLAPWNATARLDTNSAADG